MLNIPFCEESVEKELLFSSLNEQELYKKYSCIIDSGSNSCHLNTTNSENSRNLSVGASIGILICFGILGLALIALLALFVYLFITSLKRFIQDRREKMRPIEFYIVPTEMEGDNNFEQTDCVICLDSLESQEENSILKGCGHLFHTECIFEFYELSEKKNRPQVCPICKKSIRSEGSGVSSAMKTL